MEKSEFERIARQYAEMMYQVAFNYLKCREDSEDAVQNTLIRLYRYKKDFENEAHIKAWLIRVTVNESKRIRSHHRKRSEVDLDAAASELYAEDAQSRELFMEIMRLKPIYSTVLYLYYYAGYKSAEIASMLHRSDANVRAILSRARKQLKTQLEAEKDDKHE